MTRPISLLLATSLLAGCAVGANYAKPSAPLSPTFKEAAGWTTAAPADALDRGDWWALFNDPTLSDLMGRVQVSNQTVIAAEAAYRQARALVAADRASLFPTINLSGSADRSGSGKGGSGGSTIITNANGSVTTVGGSRGSSSSTSYRAAIGASWEPDIWGRIRRTIENAKATADASAADLAAARLSMQGELGVDYFGLRQADIQIALDRATVAAYRQSLTITQNRYRAGIAARSDALQAETQLANAQADLAGLQQTRAQYEHAIAVLVGEAPGSFSIAPVDNWSLTPPDVPVGVPSTLLQRRPDIAAAERRAAAASANIGVQTAAFFPDFTLTGSYGFAATELGALLKSSNAVWSYGASSAETLLDFGARQAKVRQARAAYDQAVAQYRETVLEALQDVENQIVASRVLAQQLALRQQASTAADQAEQIQMNRYKAGQISYAEVVSTQTAANSARSALAQARAQRLSAAVSLIQALGGGWRADAPAAASAPATLRP